MAYMAMGPRVAMELWPIAWHIDEHRVEVLSRRDVPVSQQPRQLATHALQPTVSQPLFTQTCVQLVLAARRALSPWFFPAAATPVPYGTGAVTALET